MDLETASKSLGVHYQTAYRWVRTGLLPAVKVGSEYEVDERDVERVAEQRRFRPAGTGASTPDWDAEGERFSEAVMSGDELAAARLVECLQTRGAAPLELCELLITPALKRLDDDCIGQPILPATAVMAAGICERVLGSLASPLRGRPRGLAVVASPEGERHRLPSLMAVLALRGDRWRVHHLGSGGPVSELVDFVSDTMPDLVVLSVLVSEDEAAEVYAAIAPAGVPVLIGAPGASLERLLEEAVVAARSSALRRRRKGMQRRSDQL